MTPERWSRVQALFDAAAAEPRERRAACLAARAEDAEMASLVMSMLEADASDRGEMEHAIDAAIRAATAPANDPLDARLGPYRIVSSIGHGGMGTVYLAERADGAFDQRVAIKVVRGLLDPERVRRFRAERQILASLQHPNIARLVDGGTTADGWPYLVMEFVEGQPIDEFVQARRRRLAGRLALFLTVCEAVAHAHRHLIVHRDIKPSNILVTADGTPKLLDFGIAKLLDAHETASSAQTIAGVHLTPEYAAPEQVIGAPATTATDVYALGVLLFELLTGRRPHSFDTLTAQEIERVVCHTDAPRPSTIQPDLPEDLDVIVGTALSKDARRRYASVQALVEDVRRFMDGLPIHARPATLAYRAQRFIARHRWSVAMAALFVTMLAGFSVLLAIQAARVGRERDVAQQERDAAQQVASFLVSLFEVNDPSRSRGSTITARELLDRGATQVERGLSSQPAVQSRLMDTMGRVYRQLGLYGPSVSLLTKALERREALAGGPADDVADTLQELGEVAREQGEYARAEELQRRALAMRQQLHGEVHDKVAFSLNSLGLTLDAEARYQEAEALLRRAIAMWRQARPPGDPQVAVALNNLGLVYGRMGRHAEAEPALREALEIRRAAFKGDHPLLANSLMQYGQLQNQLGQFEEAERYMRESLRMRLAVFGPDHPQVGTAYDNLASLLHDMGAYDDAEPMYRAALALTEKAYGAGHPETAITLNSLASLLEDRGDAAAAEVIFGRALDLRRATLGESHPAVARGMHNLARTLVALGRVRDAEPLVTRALEIRRQALGASHVEVAGSLGLLAQIRARQGQVDEALRLSAEGVRMLRSLVAADHPTLATALVAQSRLLADAGHRAEAVATATEAVTIRRARLAAGHPQIAEAETALAKARERGQH